MDNQKSMEVFMEISPTVVDCASDRHFSNSLKVVFFVGIFNISIKADI